MVAKVGGFVAPSLGALVIIFTLLECCRGNEWFCGGKCLPVLLLLGSIVCQGLTFFLFQSDLFCSKSETIDACLMGEAAYRSVQATICYFVCFILYLCGGTPRPLGNPMSMMKPQQQPLQQPQEGGGNNANNNTNSVKSKKKKTTNGDLNKEDYERRRKEKKIKGRGVSGRSKQQIYQDIGDGKKPSSSSKRKKSQSHSGRSGRRSSSSNNNNSSSSSALVLRDRSKERKFDDYVDTEPDGMDWSAYDPKERNEYYDRKRQSPSSQPRRGGEDNRDRDYAYYDEEEQHYLGNGDEYSDYSRGGDEGDGGRSLYSDRSGYLGTVYDDSRYSRENSRGSRHDSYRSGRSSRDQYDDDDGYVDDDYTKDGDTYGEPYDHDQDSRRGGDGYNDSYYSKRSYNDSASRYAEVKPGSRGTNNDGYDEASYNDASYVDSRYGEGGDYTDGRRRDDDDYYDGPPLT